MLNASADTILIAAVFAALAGRAVAAAAAVNVNSVPS